jgi:dimethylargininase
MILKAITRAVSRNISRCELTYKQREAADYEQAVRQHEAYCNFLVNQGVESIALEACDSQPDCCFVADTAVVLDELAVIANMGAPARRDEILPIERILSVHRQLARITPPATLDGGDVVILGKEIFVGHSRRTNRAGIEAFKRIVQPFGYKVTPVEVRGSLHLTTACSAIDRETVLLNARWIDADVFARFWVLHVPEDEPWAASTLRVQDTLCVEAGAPRTLSLVARHCAQVEALEISEFRKAEGSLSCLSILFGEANPRQIEQGINENKEVAHAE